MFVWSQSVQSTAGWSKAIRWLRKLDNTVQNLDLKLTCKQKRVSIWKEGGN